MANVRGASTILDVAARAGVSRQTVTRALNDMSDVSAATRARVIAAARELNYRPNRHAQTMVRGRTTTIGLILEDLANPYFAELASALSRAAAERDWSVLLCDVGPDREKARAQLESIVSRVDALALTGCRTDTLALLPPAVLAQGEFGLPLLMLDGPDHPRLSARVVIEVAAGMTAALEHLAAIGRHRIAFIDSTVGPDDRRDFYRASMEQHASTWPGLDISADETVEGGGEAARAVMSAAPDCDGILVYNDVMAIGVLKALHASGRNVPQDVAVIGIDGLQAGRFTTPELTTLAIDKTALASTAVSMLATILGDTGDPHPLDAAIELQLELRGSA
ncbi:LacI family DNA-binding transcriptional regulator [Microbacterium thalli]|uniref:LacI family DNA-binding transcriptional regulator n=1 Tax=Microbacterium thalli TaxID=3027921 RepID=A0ABT5SE69_9MICO|nr:LacI family DNA-binding transcriptional regulator [Microbacterium thalli]MDD7960815.1 LacI family DNA-binding transcriptional regulator [Microbacterium thalli]MDN8549960.1 LacI family DNA-binding transcriptional regulator [Microbacterium thalli]